MQVRKNIISYNQESNIFFKATFPFINKIKIMTGMRTPYLSKREVLVEEKLTKNPLKLFREWFEEACKCTQIEEPNAMCLATTTK